MLFTSLFEFADFNSLVRKEHTTNFTRIFLQGIVKNVPQENYMWLNELINTEITYISLL